MRNNYRIDKNENLTDEIINNAKEFIKGLSVEKINQADVDMEECYCTLHVRREGARNG